MATSVLLSTLRRTVLARPTGFPATGSHVFRIDGFSQVQKTHHNGVDIVSDKFEAGGHDWRIQCFPNGRASGHEGHISLSLLHGSDASTGSATVDFQMSILDSCWKPTHTKDSECRLFTYSTPGRYWGWDDFVETEDLDEEEHLKDDCLAILCDIAVYTADDAVPACTGTGVQIQVGGVTFAAHQWLLRQRCPVLIEKLSLDASTGLLNVNDDMEAQVFRALLHFIYTDSLPAGASALAGRLLVAADRYEVEGLKRVCEETLVTQIDMSSVVDSLVLAKEQRCLALKEACLEFLAANIKAAMENGVFGQLKTRCPWAIVELVERQIAVTEASAVLRRSTIS